MIDGVEWAEGLSQCEDICVGDAITVLRLGESDREWLGDIMVCTDFSDYIHGGEMLHRTRCIA